LAWLVDHSGWFTHISGHLSATGRAQDKESSPAKDRRYTVVSRDPPVATETVGVFGGQSSRLAHQGFNHGLRWELPSHRLLVSLSFESWPRHCSTSDVGGECRRKHFTPKMRSHPCTYHLASPAAQRRVHLSVGRHSPRH